MLNGFTRVAAMPQEVIEKYRDQIPSELVQIWEEDGLGTFLDGYLKVINPDDYLELVQETYFRGDISIPIFATAFGDIIVCEEKQYLRMVKYKDGSFDIFLEDLENYKEKLDILVDGSDLHLKWGEKPTYGIVFRFSFLPFLVF